MEASKKPNWMLRGFIGLSLIIHIFIFLKIAGIYNNNSGSYIELTLQQFSKPDVRRIPVPRLRPKKLTISDTKIIKPQTIAPPIFKVDPVTTPKIDNSFQTVSMPDVPENLNIAGVPSSYAAVPAAPANIAPHEEAVEYTTAREYFEMINLRIHSAKQYPESVKSRHIEGRVKVQFTLQADGSIMRIKVIKSSRHQKLDEAAVEAIKNAAPFPNPPAFLFQPPITLKVNILFELA